MLDSPIIEVIIGMIFIYSLLSVIVTQVNTVITNLLNSRAKHLKHGIEDLLTDPVVQAKFMAHPLIRLIEPRVQPEEAISAQSAQALAASEPCRLTWIPPELFSQALMDILSANADRDIFVPLLETAEQVLVGVEKAQVREMIRRFKSSGIGVMELRNTINNLSDPNDRQALNQALTYVEEIRQELEFNNESSKLIPLLDGIRHIQDPVLQKALETLLASARSIEEAQDKIEFWFDARMDQLSEMYRRNMQYLSLLIGGLLVILLNVDSLFVARTLWDDPALRQTLVETARTQLESGQLQENIDQSQAALQQAQNATPESTPDPALPTGTPTTDEALSLPVEEVQETVESLLALRLPIGWASIPHSASCQPNTFENPCADPRNLWNFAPANNPNWLGLLSHKIIGWVITIIAISQGAPFWFDLLNRIARGRQ
jgi:hypothetical protein